VCSTRRSRRFGTRVRGVQGDAREDARGAGSQLGYIERIVQGLGIPFLKMPGYEADDVIGTLSTREGAKGHDVWIVSGDKDMASWSAPACGSTTR